jgi:hypothetical protein
MEEPTASTLLFWPLASGSPILPFFSNISNHSTQKFFQQPWPHPMTHHSFIYNIYNQFHLTAIKSQFRRKSPVIWTIIIHHFNIFQYIYIAAKNNPQQLNQSSPSSPSSPCPNLQQAAPFREPFGDWWLLVPALCVGLLGGGVYVGAFSLMAQAPAP